MTEASLIIILGSMFVFLAGIFVTLQRRNVEEPGTESESSAKAAPGSREQQDRQREDVTV